MTEDNFDDRILHQNVRKILETFGSYTDDETLVFYNRDNEIFRFVYHNKTISSGHYILWLYEMTGTPKNEDLERGPLRNYSRTLSEKELNKIKPEMFKGLFLLANANVFARNTDTLYILNTAVKYHKGDFGVIYKSKTCDIEYFERDSILTSVNKTFKRQLNTNSKRKQLLKSLDFKYYSLGGCAVDKN